MDDDEYKKIVRASYGISDTPPEDMIPHEDKNLAAVQWRVPKKTRNVYTYELPIQGWVYRECPTWDGKTRTVRKAVIPVYAGYEEVELESTVWWCCEPDREIAPSEWMLMKGLYEERSVMVSDNWVPMAEVKASVLQEYDKWRKSF
jgi:hypothetical protein